MKEEGWRAVKERERKEKKRKEQNRKKEEQRYQWQGNTVVHKAVLARNTEAIKILLTSKCVNLKIKNSQGLTPLDVALKEDLTEIAELLSSAEKSEKCSFRLCHFSAFSFALISHIARLYKQPRVPAGSGALSSFGIFGSRSLESESFNSFSFFDSPFEQRRIISTSVPFSSLHFTTLHYTTLQFNSFSFFSLLWFDPICV